MYYDIGYDVALTLGLLVCFGWLVWLTRVRTRTQPMVDATEMQELRAWLQTHFEQNNTNFRSIRQEPTAQVTALRQEMTIGFAAVQEQFAEIKGELAEIKGELHYISKMLDAINKDQRDQDSRILSLERKAPN